MMAAPRTLLLSLYLCAIFNLDRARGDAVSVPGPPESATLDVISSDSLEVSFSPPLSDGGSPVTSYTVEWDKEAGVPEVQRISTSLDLNANEIQAITTSTVDVNEVQVVRTSATPQGEVQTITVSPPPGESAVDAAYAFAIKLDTVEYGGSVQYSGQISATASADGSRGSVSDVLGAMSNVREKPSVVKSGPNPDGGHTYTITFPTSMRNVPEMEVFMSDVPLFISTVQEGNVLGGTFRLELDGEMTADIPYDATESEMQSHLEDLPSVGTVEVSRSLADEQNGYSWKIEFTSDENGGDVADLLLHSAGLTTTGDAGGAVVELSTGGRDGSYIQGSFTIGFGGETTVPIASDADAATVKGALEALSTVGKVDVSRSTIDVVGGCTWTVSFLEDEAHTHRGDMPAFVVTSSLTGGFGEDPAIAVREIRKGTVKEVQTVSISAGGASVDPTSSFKLSFLGEETSDILALPIGGVTCLGSTAAKQIITTSTEDTRGEGGDNAVSPLTSFVLAFEGYTTSRIPANAGTCEETAQTIAEELMKLPPLHQVSVTGSDSGAGDEGCSWIATFESVTGNPDLLTVTAFHGALSSGPGTTVTVGPSPSIIRDSISITQPEGFRGDVQLIQSELSKLSTIGIVTVSVDSPVPDAAGQCSWRITFETKAGDLPPLQAAKSGTSDFSSTAILNSGDAVTVTDDAVKGTSASISGDFTLDFNGEKTGYLPHDVSPDAMKAALDSLETLRDVNVQRHGPDVNNCFSWDVTFMSDLGPLHLIVADGKDLVGTVATVSVLKVTEGSLPPFDGPDYGFRTITDLSDLSVVASPLKQGIPYYFRVSSANALGSGPYAMPNPPVHIPLPQPPAEPPELNISVRDGSTLSVAIGKPAHNGGEQIESYRVDYSTSAFTHEIQRVSLTCSPSPEIQRVTTSAQDINEVQYIVIDSDYKGLGVIHETQRVICDATGGTFGLSFAGDTAYINYDDDESTVKAAIEELSSIIQVSIEFENGATAACAPFDGSSPAASFLVTFESLSDLSGDLPLMTAETSNLDGGRRVDITVDTEGDAPVGGSFRLSFRGSLSDPIDASKSLDEVAVAIDLALEGLDTVEAGGVVVSTVPLSSGGQEKIFRVEFQGEGVGGDVVPIEIVPEHKHVRGTSADVYAISDGEVYLARNGVDQVVSQVGNSLSGYFRLRLRGHTTDDIPFNAAIDTMKTRLEALPNVGSVSVEVSPPTKERGYSWTITFLSSPGYFPPLTRNVDRLEYISFLSTSVESDSSADITVDVVKEGDDRLDGKFQLAFDDGVTTQMTPPLQNFITAEDLKEELENLSNVGRVSVTRSELDIGYDWDIEFDGCALKGNADVCNEGDLLPLSFIDHSLTGCGGPSVQVSELVAGSEASACPHFDSGFCTEERSVVANSDFPLVHDIRKLSLGQPYYVQARFRNSQSYSYRRLSSPLHVSPHHNPPGAPPSVVLKESTATSITVMWYPPTVNGGTAVSGYELWMDDWSGEDRYMVYDGTDDPSTLEYQVTTNDVGPLNQVLETGRQYRFQVRAMNNCDTRDPDKACHGEFSDVQIFTVREPRNPMPPSAPERDSRSAVTGLTDASIAISWSRPIDNGGSPITGYVLYMKWPDDSTTHHALGPETTFWVVEGLNPGEVYSFHVVAINALGRSGNSPSLTTTAAVLPGMDIYGAPVYSTSTYRPAIIDVQETSMTVEWTPPGADITGGSPITGYKLYVYEGIGPNTKSVPEPVRQEVQHIVITGSGSIKGTFTISFRGHETGDISTEATPSNVQFALENLDSINVVNVESISNGWSVTFLSEAGDLPLMEATSGRLLGAPNAAVSVSEHIKGDACTLIYDGSDNPSSRNFIASDLLAEARYAFKVAPINALGDGVLSLATTSTLARAGASAQQTTASGSALASGIAGSIREEQIIVFASNDCDSDSLVLSLGGSQQTPNLCASPATEFESALEELPGVGDVHVSRRDMVTLAGSSGYAWSVTFMTWMGDVPALTVDLALVNNGMDASDVSGIGAVYVTEFLKGQANEFVIEPKKSSGAVVRDVTVSDGMEGQDVFFSELWTSDGSVVDGSHEWYSDGGVGSYNPVRYEEQVLSVPVSAGPFHLYMDTSEGAPKGRIGGFFATTVELPGGDAVTDIDLQKALSNLVNVGKVIVSKVGDNGTEKRFTVTFVSVYGEMPLLSTSDESIAVLRNEDQIGVTEIQTITSSVDQVFTYEVQQVSVLSSASSFSLAFASSPATDAIPCDFASEEEAQSSVEALKVELENIPGVVVRVDSQVLGSGIVGDPWSYTITFLEPVGPLPLLTSDNADVFQLQQGESTVAGTMVLSYGGQYTGDIPFDASAEDVKQSLESLPTIEEVNVQKVDKRTGYQWIVSFTKSVGNLPNIAAHKNVFEIQTIETMGGYPTPLGGTFTLSYLSEETSPLKYDSSAEEVKSALEYLPSIERVDVNRLVRANGQFTWTVMFRRPESPVLLSIDSAHMSGTLDDASVSVTVAANPSSLVSKSGAEPTVVVEEKVAGLPSYTGRYVADSVGAYSLAVMQLESGGLSAKYYDNQWLLDTPVMERVDPTVNFNWGTGTITPYGRDYVSVRWWGKIKTKTSEKYTFYVHADDGVRLYINHDLVVDAWDDRSNEKREDVELSADEFHDIKLEYKEETGPANVQLQWSSRSIRKQVVPSDQLYFATHISGSPFSTVVSPGAADYPYSDFVSVPGQDRTVAIAGEPTSFLIQAKDSTGNNKIFDGDSQGDAQSPEEQFTCDIVGPHSRTSGSVSYVGSGQYRVDYSLLKAGTYTVHVKTGGTDIYCGRGEDDRCSPFKLTVRPGPTVASNCEAESTANPYDNLVEARAGEKGIIHVQAKDAYGNNRDMGGDNILTKFSSTSHPDIQYRGNVADNGDGSYTVSYSIPMAGTYAVSITVGDNAESVQYCVGASGDRWNVRQYDGISVYSAPPFCSTTGLVPLHVVHRELHGLSSTVVDGAFARSNGPNSAGIAYDGLTSAVVGTETGFVIESRDKFGNLRSGDGTSNVSNLGDGSSDAFLVTLAGPGGYKVVTSSAVQVVTCLDSTVDGYFRLAFGGTISTDLPYDVSAAAMQVSLSTAHGMEAASVEVERKTIDGNHQWSVTFLSHLSAWSTDPLVVMPGSDGLDSVSETMVVSKVASGGLYPIRYTVWQKGTYELSITSGTSNVSESTYTVEVSDGAVQASSSIASGQGLVGGIAGEEFTFEVQAKDQRQSEVQAVWASGVVIDFVNEIQRIRIESISGEYFTIAFRGETSAPLEVGTSTILELTTALESLPTIGTVSLSTDGSETIHTGDQIDIEFLSEHGRLDLLAPSGLNSVSRVIEGEAPFRKETQVMICDADGGEATLSYKGNTVVLRHDDDLVTVRAQLIALVRGPVTIIESDSAITTLCSSDNGIGKKIFVAFDDELGDARPIMVQASSMTGGSIAVFGDGESENGAVNGIHPVMGSFKFVLGNETSASIAIDATATEMQAALESLPSIGAVTVSKDVVGIRAGSGGVVPNLSPGMTSLFSIWSITFADEGTAGCEPGHWNRCPGKVGDIPLLTVDSSSLTFSSGATQLQAPPVVETFEIKKGSSGNNREDGEDLASIEFSLTHVAQPEIGIDMHEVQTLSCSYSTGALATHTDGSGSFQLQFLSQSIFVEATMALHDLEVLLADKLSLVTSVSTAGSSHGTVCHYDPSSPTTALTKLTFAVEDGPLPVFEVSFESNVVVSVINEVDAVDGVEYVGGGRYVVKYTPTISGHYSASLTIGSKSIWTDLSQGVVVHPSDASAPHSTHDSRWVATEGEEESFHIVPRDRFGNKLLSELASENSFLVRLDGIPDVCSGLRNGTSFFAEVDGTDARHGGPYTVTYMPALAGTHHISTLLRSRGGLLATYYKNEDFTEPVRGNNNHHVAPYHAVSWCPHGEYVCDSTALDFEVSFDWGFGSPLAHMPDFPIDAFSVVWEGEIKVPSRDFYTFAVTLNGGVRVTIGSRVILDYLPVASSETIASDPVQLDGDEFHAFKVEYIHSTDEAHIELRWMSSTIPWQVVPSSAFFYTRRVGNSTSTGPSPFPVSILPGAIDVSTTAEGDGLSRCVANNECSFVIQTKDSSGNCRFNSGFNPDFQITMVGVGDWAGQGRINDDLSSTAAATVLATVSAEDWSFLGTANVEHQSLSVSTETNLIGSILRGDAVVIEGQRYTISKSGTFDETSIPLATAYLGPSKSGVSIYKASRSCGTGTHSVTYTPNIRGDYELDVKLPSEPEVQRITTHVSSDSSLSGTFSLVLQNGDKSHTSNGVSYDAGAIDMKDAIESLPGMGEVAVSVDQCTNPAETCSWDITFLGFQGDVKKLMPDLSGLAGNSARVSVTEMTKGQKARSISGFPRKVTVVPDRTDPSWTTAYGEGLVAATAGSVANFTIQAKDAFGNDRLTSQGNDLFTVMVFPEDAETLEIPSAALFGNVTSKGNGAYEVAFSPEKSGYHAIAVVQTTTFETQVITTMYGGMARGGTFVLSLDEASTPAIPWDADAAFVKEALESIDSIPSVSVNKESVGHFNYQYTIVFDFSCCNLSELQVDVSNLEGNQNPWAVSSGDGDYAHIKMSPTTDVRGEPFVNDYPQYEVQRVVASVTTNDISPLAFTLSFLGHATEPIPYSASAAEITNKLERLSTVGKVTVSKLVDNIDGESKWDITFTPNEGDTSESVRNFGNLPYLVATENHADMTVSVVTLQNGASPFRVWVAPAEASASNITAEDYPGVLYYEGKSTGVYKSDAHFYLQVRDEFSNMIMDGPISEVQIIETSSTSALGGEFSVSVWGETVTFPSNAGIGLVEKGLRSLPGIGAVSVASNSAKDLVPGKTVSVTKGLDTLVPSSRLIDFEVGDWIRIGDRDEGPIFSIVHLADLSPYTVTLSSAYAGPSDGAAPIYQHGAPGSRLGYQYIISFDPNLGDLPALSVQGDDLTGDGALISVASCDWFVHQMLQTSTTGTTALTGTFYLAYRGERTRDLPISANGPDLKRAVEEDLSSINTITVVDEEDLGVGMKKWHLRLDSYEGDAELLFAEGHLLSSGPTGVAGVSISPICPTASRDDPLYSSHSRAGRQGYDFVISLDGPEEVKGTASHVEDGKYLVTYQAPKTGEYSMSVKQADVGGLAGEYFNNRWLFEPAVNTRVDNGVDFYWTETEALTPTGKDFVSIRWTGYLKPAFDEVYIFTVHVNDGVKLWIGGELLIDEYENEVDQGKDYDEFSASTERSLVAGRLVDIMIEFRENQGTALLRLFWESPSQPQSIVPAGRLYSGSTHILDSPFTVSPVGIEPSKPLECNLRIADWDKLELSWHGPEDDGGEDLTKYRVEYWDGDEYGELEQQQLRLKKTITGGSFALSVGSHNVKMLVGATAAEFEAGLESLPNVGDVLVSKEDDAESVVYTITFLTDVAPVPHMSIDAAAVSPSSEVTEYCVCVGGESYCDSGSLSSGCDPSSSQRGTASTSAFDVAVSDLDFQDELPFVYTINGLVQRSDDSAGFGVRVSAGNSRGFGTPCDAVFLKPMGIPNPPSFVEVVRDPSSASSLTVHFTMVSDPEDKGSIVDSFLIEWSTSSNFSPFDTMNATMSASALQSDRLSSFSSANNAFLQFTIENLTPGRHYYVRVAAKNTMGVGQSASSHPLYLAPGMKPAVLDEQNGVTLSTIAADSSVTVHESSTSILVSWHAPPTDNGFPVTSYLIEYWISPGVDEVQQISLLSSGGDPILGTFTISYDGAKTDSLSIDCSAEELQVALESLSTLRSVHVDRTGSNPDYTWVVTFQSEYPAVFGKMLVVEDETELADSSSGGGAPTMQVAVTRAGTMPSNYKTVEVESDDEASRTSFGYVLNELTAGQPYTVQVSALNDLGYSRPRMSVPRSLAPPKQKPSEPTDVALAVDSGESLRVLFSKPDSNGGDAVTQYKIQWDTRSTFDSKENSPLGSYTKVLPLSSVVCDPCEHVISGLVKGKDYYVRVYSYNAYGYSTEAGLPTPTYMSPKTQPLPPESVDIMPLSDSEINVSFPSSHDDGGATITKYKVEWNAMGYSIGLHSSVVGARDALYSLHSVQTITTSSDAYDLSGSFRVAFGGHATRSISAAATGDEVDAALENLPTIGSVSVSREALLNGFVWSVTFLTNMGDESLTVSIDPADIPSSFVVDTFGASMGSLLGTNPRLVVDTPIQALKGYEQQIFTTQCSAEDSVIGGHFTVTHGSSTSATLAFDATADDLKGALESIGTGSLLVTRERSPECSSTFAFRWTIVFTELLGNVPLLAVHDLLTCSDVSCSAHIYASESVSGVVPAMDGADSGSKELELSEPDGLGTIHNVNIPGLTRGMPYHIRVSAWNGVGFSYGPQMYSTPAIVAPVGTPDPPNSVTARPLDDATLRIGWSQSLGFDGNRISKYKVEWAEDATETGHNQSNELEGAVVEHLSEVQEITVGALADDLGGFFALQFMGEQSVKIYHDSAEADVRSALEGMSTIDKVSVSMSLQELSTVPPLSRFGRKWTVTFASPGGALPSLLVDTGDGSPSTIATGGTLTGSSPVVRVETLSKGQVPTTYVTSPNLVSGRSYSARVSAFNGVFWSQPAMSKFTVSPSKQVSSAPRNVKISIVSDTELGISWDSPEYDGGSTIGAYSVQWDTDSAFDYQSAKIDAVDGGGSPTSYNYTIGGLDATQSYMVRVIAINQQGFSEPAMAVPVEYVMEDVEIELLSNSGTVDWTESFYLRCTTSVSNEMTKEMSVYAEPAEVEEELNQLESCVGAVSVEREDHSEQYDSSGVGTNLFRVIFHLTFLQYFGDHTPVLSVEGSNLGTISANVLQQGHT